MADLPAPLSKALDSLERTAETKDSKATALSLRLLHGLRSAVPLATVASLLKHLFGAETAWAEPAPAPLCSYKSDEVEMYLSLVAVMQLIKAGNILQAEQVLLAQVGKAHERNAEPLIAKAYYYLALIHEIKGDLSVNGFLQSYRKSCLKHDTYSQAVLINVVLRFYLLSNKVQLAKEFAEKSGFPDTANYPEIARNQFYLGKLKALTLNYVESHGHLVQAARKAPEHGANGFKLAVEKLRIIVELLMGQIPSRKNLLGLKGLAGYIQLIRAVRVGELEQFNAAMQNYSQLYVEDMNYSLVTRLRHIVIKSGLKRINLAYSVIALGDVALKLGLKNEDTEFIVAKAIRDGVIEAVIDHEKQELRSKVLEDVYTTNEPQSLLQKRIEFCMSLRNDTVKALQFPQNKANTEVKESAEDIDFDLISEEDDF
jgi:26S proteasome regulatory subunit N3